MLRYIFPLGIKHGVEYWYIHGSWKFQHGYNAGTCCICHVTYTFLSISFVHNWLSYRLSHDRWLNQSHCWISIEWAAEPPAAGSSAHLSSITCVPRNSLSRKGGLPRVRQGIIKWGSITGLLLLLLLLSVSITRDVWKQPRARAIFKHNWGDATHWWTINVSHEAAADLMQVNIITY